MSFADERDGERRRRPAEQSEGDPLRSVTKPKARKNAPEFGHALRSAYERTLDEAIPPEMLDLLGKLG